MKKEKGARDLILHEQSVVKLCDFYFMQFVYRHKTEKVIKYTMKEMGQNITIVKLKSIRMDQFQRKVGVEEVVGAIEETLIEYETQIMIDAATKQVYQQWALILRKFIDDDAKLMKIVTEKINSDDDD